MARLYWRISSPSPYGTRSERGIATVTISAGKARRYPADVAPFVSIEEPSIAALEALRSLLVPAEEVWICGSEVSRLARVRLGNIA